MHRFLTLLFTIVLVVALGACGDTVQPSDEDAGPDSSVDGVVVDGADINETEQTEPTDELGLSDTPVGFEEDDAVIVEGPTETVAADDDILDTTPQTEATTGELILADTPVPEGFDEGTASPLEETLAAGNGTPFPQQETTTTDATGTTDELILSDTAVPEGFGESTESPLEETLTTDETTTPEETTGTATTDEPELLTPPANVTTEAVELEDLTPTNGTTGPINTPIEDATPLVEEDATPTERVANETTTPTEGTPPGAVGASTDESLISVLLDTADFTTLLFALQAADLVDRLEGESDITIFAPTNEAFSQLPPTVLSTLFEDQNLLQEVLLYHVLDGRVYSTEITEAASITGIEAQTLQGETITIRTNNIGLVINDIANVQTTDIDAENAVIHVIDTVLLPPDLSMTDIVGE
ncbi:MAG: fasciclin domain-containing protein [Chloroflexaceae bacterium]|nr:fasciclin domain-containing protein [Chloroflexaceae bacterium]